MSSQESKGFEIQPLSELHTVLDDIDGFRTSMERGEGGAIGSLYLPGNIRQIDAAAYGHGSTFDLSFSIYPGANWSSSDITNHIEKKFRTEKKAASLIVLSENRIPLFTVSSRLITDSKIEFVQIQTGFGYDVANKKVRFIESPKTTNEMIKSRIEDFSTLMNPLMAEAGIFVKEPFYLQPPARTKEISIPDELVGKISIERSDISLDQIGGQKKAKDEMRSLSFALKNPELYRKWGTHPPKGLLLYGPPGTGKTLLAKALASESNAQFFHIEASDILSKWYGESETLLKKVFDFVHSTDQPTILFFDEVDAIAPSRESLHSANHTTSRILTTLLENIDGMTSKENVIIVASTNRRHAIDRALLRSGRLSVHVEVPLPDAIDREQIFGIHMQKANEIAGRNLFENIDFGRLASKSENFNGSDISEIIRRTLEEKVRKEGMGQKPSAFVTTQDILRHMFPYEHKSDEDHDKGDTRSSFAS